MASLKKKERPLMTKSGDVLTDEVIEALAREAEEGYDLSLARRERVGRPPLGTGPSPRLSFRTSRALYEAARSRAKRDGCSLSDLARQAIERYLAG